MRPIVIIMEDEADSRDWLVEALTTEGYDVLCAANGADGLARVATLPTRASLVLLDMRMPVMNGWDVLAALARFRPRPPVVIITADTQVHGVPAGAEAVLMKPLHVEDLLDVVRRHAVDAA